jgi:hypothetical protein
MILYPSRDPWLFLERGLHVPLKSRLRVAIRNKMPLAASPFQNLDDGIHISAEGSRVSLRAQDKSQEWPLVHEPECRQSSINPVRQPSTEMIQEPESKDTPTESTVTVPPANKTTRSSNPAANAETIFNLSTLGITYDRLTRINPSAKIRADRSKARFYLSFAASEELEYLKNYLGKYTLPKLIYTSTESDGWDTFKETLGDNIGVILV